MNYEISEDDRGDEAQEGPEEDDRAEASAEPMDPYPEESTAETPIELGEEASHTRPSPRAGDDRLGSGQTARADWMSMFGGSRSGSSRNRTIYTVITVVILLFLLSRGGFFDRFGAQPPVNYLLSEPQIETIAGRSVATVWVNVPESTSIDVMEDLILNFVVAEISRDRSVSRVGSIRFYMLTGFRRGTTDLKEPSVDEPDQIIRFVRGEGIRLE